MLNIKRHLRRARKAWMQLCTGTPAGKALDEEHYRQQILVMASTAWLLAVIALTLITPAAIEYSAAGRRAANFLFAFTGSGVAISMLLLRFAHNRELALNIMLLVFGGEFAAACFFFGGSQSPTYALLLLVPLLAAIAGSVLLACTWGLAVLAFWGVLLFAETAGIEFQQIIKPENYLLAIFISQAAMAICILAILIIYAETNKQLRKSLQASNAELEHLSLHDKLTKLPNRRFYDDRMTLALQRSAARNSMTGLLFIDLNGFKEINDTYGHGAGDRLLIATAQRLQRALRETDLVARIGGDEFAVVLEDVQSTDELMHIASKLSQAVEQPLSVRQHQLSFSASIGLAVFPDDGRQKAELEEKADRAMYFAKKRGVPVALASLEASDQPYPARIDRGG